MTSKLQVTLPKALATQYGIRPGDELLWVASGDAIRVVPARSVARKDSAGERLKLFEQSVERRRRRYKRPGGPEPSDRGWTRLATGAPETTLNVQGTLKDGMGNTLFTNGGECRQTGPGPIG